MRLHISRFKLRRLNIRLKIGRITFFGVISKTQTLKGMGSLVNKKEHLHYIFWDFADCTLKQVEQTLKKYKKSLN